MRLASPTGLGAARWGRGRFAGETAPGGRSVECARRACGKAPPPQRRDPAHHAAHPERPVEKPEASRPNKPTLPVNARRVADTIMRDWSRPPTIHPCMPTNGNLLRGGCVSNQSVR